MAQEIINIGTIANDGTGDGLRDAFEKAQNNTTELYNLIQTNGFVLVNHKDKLPAAVSNAINFEGNVTYYITNNIDLTGDRIILGENTTIIGGSSENCSITSTGLGVGVPLITGNYSAPIRHIAIKDVDTAFDLDGTGNTMALDWTGLNLVNVPNVGTITEASNWIYSKGAFLNSQGLKFDGTVGTIGIDNSLFVGDGTAGNIIEILPTATINTRFRTIYSSVVAFGSTVGIDVDASATIGNEDFILDNVNFSGGSTYLGGIDHTDNKSLFVNCNGITNSSEIASYYMNNNATVTTITTVDTAVKIEGTTTDSAVTQKFTHTNNRQTYVGSITRFFKVSATVSFDSGNNKVVGCYIYKNGVEVTESEVYGTTNGSGRAENVTIQAILELQTNDYVEIWIENSTDTTNVTVTDLNVILQ